MFQCDMIGNIKMYFFSALKLEKNSIVDSKIVASILECEAVEQVRFSIQCVV